MDEPSDKGAWLIDSLCEDGRRFRPGDWVERISASLASFGKEHRLQYADEVRPCIIEGRKCLLVEKALQERRPELYHHIMRFARENHLIIREDRRERPRP